MSETASARTSATQLAMALESKLVTVLGTASGRVWESRSVTVSAMASAMALEMALESKWVTVSVTT
jgi:hypothetical protein